MTAESAAIGRGRFAFWGPGKWRAGRLVLGVALLALTVVVATSVGAVGIPAGETARIILAHLHLANGTTIDPAHDAIVWQVRLPRVLSAVVVGAGLAISGAGYQAVFRNPLADPYLLGVAAGAALGATVATVSSLSLSFLGFNATAVLAFAGALAAVALSSELARVGRTVPPTAHILAGVAVSTAATAGSSLLMMLHEDRVIQVLAWLYGDFTTSSWHKLELVAPYVAITSIVLLLLGRQLNALQLGDDEARSLGLRVQQLRFLVIVSASLSTAVCVATSGLIGFVGLVVPHACRLLFGPDHRVLLPMTLVLGAILLVLADLGARTVMAPQEIPVGVLTAACGAPFFLFLLRRQRNRLIAP